MATLQKNLKWYRGLADKKGRLGAGAFLVEGEKAIRQVIGNLPEAITEIIATQQPPLDFQPYLRRIVTASQLRYISSTRTPQGIAAVVKIPPDIYSTRLPKDAGHKVLLLEDIQDPGNAGTLIRTAAAFDFSGVILTDQCADPLSPKVVQATAGTLLSLWLKATPHYLEIVEALRERGYRLVTATLDGQDSPQVVGQSKLILALGSEAAGLSPALLEMADYGVRLPIARGKAESLNVAVCGGILMYLSQG